MQTTQLVKTLNKGQVTIPAKLRKKLGIKKNDYLRVYARGKKLILEPVSLQEKGVEKYIRTFSDRQINQWLELDKLDAKTRKKAQIT
ncbi:AbrB/MazE/SpoVT family DNA-binding domain-containing protein [Patescibacteria group bacterium]|nr:AbrB/MazE/SpoVT family DNA-binding domain-containing protein [Patescibacteria group bacterium]